MFTFLKTFFTAELGPTAEDFNTKGETENMFSITEANGRFFITDRHGNVAGSSTGYSRRRDAARGAARSGLTLA